MKQYGVEVVNFIPGSLVMCTNITARQEQYATEMLTAFTDEQLEFYGEYFDRYMNYLKHISGTQPVQVIEDGNIFIQFRNAIIDYTPRAIYKCEPLRYVELFENVQKTIQLLKYLNNVNLLFSFFCLARYKIYHNLFKFSPVLLRDWLIVKFMRMPTYK